MSPRTLLPQLMDEEDSKQLLVHAAVQAGSILAAGAGDGDRLQQLSEGEKRRLCSTLPRPLPEAAAYWEDALAVTSALMQVDDAKQRKRMFEAGTTKVKAQYVACVSQRIRGLIAAGAQQQEVTDGIT